MKLQHSIRKLRLPISQFNLEIPIAEESQIRSEAIQVLLTKFNC